MASVLSGKPALSNTELQILRVTHGGSVFYRVLAGPYSSEVDAAGLCRDYRVGESDAFCKIVR
jgi:hypothetical protein